MTTIAFVVNGDFQSAMGHRARAFAKRLSQSYQISLAYRSARKLISLLRFFFFLARTRPACAYVFDIGYSGVLAAVLYKFLFRRRLIVETGDAITELVRSTQSRGRLGIWLTDLIERIAFRFADRVVVRGSFHRELLARQGIAAEVIQDGVDLNSFVPLDVSNLRSQYGLSDVLTMGLIGSSVWSEKLKMCYGWDLIEALHLLKDKPVKGVFIGSGSGIAHLKSLCREYELQDRVLFLGYVPFEELPHFVNLIDICLSTQTNNVVGQVRTTGKLPLYLAAGRYVLASNVGEARLVLNQEMLVDYQGVKDEDYPRKLKDRIESLLNQPELLQQSDHSRSVAARHFDYEMLAVRMREVLSDTLGGEPYQI